MACLLCPNPTGIWQPRPAHVAGPPRLAFGYSPNEPPPADSPCFDNAYTPFDRLPGSFGWECGSIDGTGEQTTWHPVYPIETFPGGAEGAEDAQHACYSMVEHGPVEYMFRDSEPVRRHGHSDSGGRPDLGEDAVRRVS